MRRLRLLVGVVALDFAGREVNEGAAPVGVVDVYGTRDFVAVEFAVVKSRAGEASLFGPDSMLVINADRLRESNR